MLCRTVADDLLDKRVATVAAFTNLESRLVETGRTCPRGAVGELVPAATVMTGLLG